MPFRRKRGVQAITKERHLHQAVDDYEKSARSMIKNDILATLPDRHPREEEVNEGEVNGHRQNGALYTLAIGQIIQLNIHGPQVKYKSKHPRVEQALQGHHQ